VKSVAIELAIRLGGPQSRLVPAHTWASLTAVGKLAEHLDFKGFAVEP
jgi:hypothetical protein